MMRLAGARMAAASLVAAIGVATLGCGGGDPAPVANNHQPAMQQPAVNLNPTATGAAGQSPAPAPLAANAPERKPAPAAVASLRAFLLAMVQRDQAAIERLSFEHPERPILWQGEPPPPEFLADAQREIGSIEFHKVMPGDQVLGLDGVPLVVKEGDLKPNQIMLTFAENPIPFFLEEDAGAWRVQAAPIITLRKSALEDAAAAAAEAAQPTGPGQVVQQPGVTPADQLGPPPGTQFLPPPSGQLPPGVQPIAQPGVQPLPPGVQPIAPSGPPPGVQPGTQFGTRPSPPPR